MAIFSLLFSYRPYLYAVTWRHNGEGQSSNSYLYTKTFKRPIDVPSDEEPIDEPGIDQWQGFRVIRKPLPAHERDDFLGMIFD